MRLFFWFGVLAAPVMAQANPVETTRGQEIRAFLGGHGCTLGAESAAAAIDAGFAFDELQIFALNAQAAGQAEAQGAYVVLGPEICSIRLPQIQSRWAVSDPEIIAMAPFIREEFMIGEETYIDQGCFLTAGMEGFVDLNGGDVDAGYRDYMQFMAAGLISGEVRMYSDDPLRTPPGLQLMTGDCADLPNVADIRRSHDALVERFGEWVRQSYEGAECGGFGEYGDPMFPIRAQGADPVTDAEDQPAINALLGIEWMIITVGAGWREGDSANEKGVARPPLCHIP